jgi:hypothetical protein
MGDGLRLIGLHGNHCKRADLVALKGGKQGIFRHFSGNPR